MSTDLAEVHGRRRRARRGGEVQAIDHLVRLVAGMLFGFLIGAGLWDWLVFEGANWSELSLGRFAWIAWVLPPALFAFWVAGWTQRRTEVHGMGRLGLLFGIVHSGALYLLYASFGGVA